MTWPEAIPISSWNAKQALIVRDAIYTRIAGLSGMFKTLRKTAVPVLLPAQLPACSIFYMGEDSPSWGDPNIGILKYQTDFVIGISVTRGFDDPVLLETGLAEDVVTIKNLLLTDAVFTKRAPPNEGAFFESIPRIRVEMIFPHDAEATFAELRLAMTFRLHQVFVPLVTDYLKEVDVKVHMGRGVTPIEELILVPDRPPNDED